MHCGEHLVENIIRVCEMFEFRATQMIVHFSDFETILQYEYLEFTVLYTSIRKKRLRYSRDPVPQNLFEGPYVFHLHDLDSVCPAQVEREVLREKDDDPARQALHRGGGPVQLQARTP